MFSYLDTLSIGADLDELSEGRSQLNKEIKEIKEKKE
jgi:hypothetical protein